MRGWIRAGTHLCAAFAGAGLIWTLSGGRKMKAISAIHAKDSGSAAGSGNRDVHEGPEDFRRMLDAMATEPMFRTDRLALRKELLKSWAAKDPEGVLIWFEGQPWLSLQERPSLDELAWRNPDFLFRHAMEHGDRGLLNTLVSGNPEAALRLLGSTGNGYFLNYYVSRIFERGVEVDPAFVKELDRIESPEVKAQAFASASDTLAKSRSLSGLMDLWKTHPDLLDGKTLGSALKEVSNKGAEPSGELLSLVQMPSQQDSGMDRPVWLGTFLGKLQEILLPGRGAGEWQALVENSGIFTGLNGEDAEQLLEFVRGGGSDAAGRAMLAGAWARGEACSLSDIVALRDPVLYDACIVTYMDRPDVDLNPGETWADSISRISDPELRAEMEQKHLTQPDEDSGKDPFAASSEK